MLDNKLMKEAVERSYQDEKFQKLTEKYNLYLTKEPVQENAGCLGCGAAILSYLGIGAGAAMYLTSIAIAAEGNPDALPMFELAGKVGVAPFVLFNDMKNNADKTLIKLGNELDSMVRTNYVRCQIEQEEIANGVDIETAKENAERIMQGDVTERFENLEKDIQEFERENSQYFSYRRFDEDSAIYDESLVEETEEVEYDDQSTDEADFDM